ncbi:hypothetical protein RJ639_035551 [Escallonia herrerae]|uniref:Transposase (putative) gypsy type domain-containing protein n=1 Tax=Escallonia herrerae TaxID=1293975 RepID=A0AA88WNL9_9ASTE|nr:hypothetical protein RJ639_035551 [Escallonia herrerae]
MLGQVALCQGRELGHNSALAELLLDQMAFCPLPGHNSARAKLCSAKCHPAWAECLAIILLRQNCARPSGILLRQSARPQFCSCRINRFQLQKVNLELQIHNLHSLQLHNQYSLRLHNLHSLRLYNLHNLRLHNLHILCPRKNALRDVKDQAEDKANPMPWYTADEKSSKMSTGDLLELIQDYPLPKGYRLPLHPFALRFFEHYHMAPGQLVPNGWRKFAELIYLVQTSGYKPDATDFMRVFFEICFVNGVANCPGWYYIHSRQRLLKGVPKLNKGKPTRNNLTKHIFSHIKLQGGLSINEPLSEQQLEWAMIIPRKPIPMGALIPPSPSTSAESVPLEMASESEKAPRGGFLGVLQKAKGKRKEKQPSVELPPPPKRMRVTPHDRSP